jgi:Na+-transporting NADH:ubiquinone oxidoreductase subunit NqrD
MQLIDNWKDSLKLSSVQTGLAISALGFAEQAMPQLQAVLPPAAYGVLGLLVWVARLIVQNKLRK